MLDTNGADLSALLDSRGSLLTARKCNNLSAREATEKKGTIERILAGPPYSAKEKIEILDYCQQDVDDAGELFEVLSDRISSGNPHYLDQALLRCEYSKSMATMTRTGCPINVPLHDLVVSKWETIRRALIGSVSHF